MPDNCSHSSERRAAATIAYNYLSKKTYSRFKMELCADAGQLLPQQ
jgi:hypothetical protein